MSLFEFWRKRKERREVLQRSRGRKLDQSELKRLLGDGGVRAALGDSRVASLLPPVGTEVFRRFTAASLEESQRRYEAKEEERKKRKNNQEAKTVQTKPTNDLREERTLPFFYGDPPPELLNTPLEELDPYYQSDKTFLVLGKGNIIHRFDSGSACLLFSPFNPLRIGAIRVLIHSFFRFFVMLTVLTNCVFMMIEDKPDWNYIMECIFLAVYTLEVIIKVLSRGVCVGKCSFLRDPWNWLDVLVISTMLLSEFVVSVDLSFLTLFPRILKLLPLIPGMKSTMKVLIQSGKRLAGVTVLTVFCLSFFALIGLQLFMGQLKNKCVMWPVNVTDSYHENGTLGFDFYKYINNNSNYYYLPGQLDALLCGNSSASGMCPGGFTCLKTGQNPTYGYTSFDWFGPSLLSMVRLMTHDFWEHLMMLTLRAAGKEYLAVFLLVFFPGCFCLLCLIISAVAMAIGEQEEAAVAKAHLREREFSQIRVALESGDEEQRAASRAALSETEGEKIPKKQHNKVEGPEDGGWCSPCGPAFTDPCLKWTCCGCWLKQRIFSFVMHPMFDLFIVLCLVLNIVFMGMEHYPMSERFESTLATADLVFLFIFLAEMVLRIIALDPYGYFRVGWNIFDCIIISLSFVMMMFELIGFWLTVLRVFRLARWWPAFHKFLKLVWSSVCALRNLTLVLLVLVFLFSVVDTQLFQNNYRDCACRISTDCELPRWHMSDFYHSFLLVCRVLFGEWIETLWDCMQVSNKATCLLFFMTLVVIGKLLVMSLFLTLLLSWVTSDCLYPSQQTERTSLHAAVVQIRRTFRRLLGKENPDPTAADSEDGDRKDGLALDLVTSDQYSSELQALKGETSERLDIESQRVPIAEIQDPLKAEKEMTSDDETKCPEGQPDQQDPDQRGTPEDCCCDGCYRCCPLLDLNKSQSLGRVWSTFRRSCLSIIQHRAFEAFIFLIIVLSCTALVFEDIHLPQRQVLKMVVEIADQVFTFVFLLEMLLKWSALGLKKYFTDAWCWLDFLILDVSLACLIAGLMGSSEWGASIFSLRALMPLRILSRVQGLRVVVHTLVRSFPSLFDVVLVSLMVWFVFCLVGVRLFAGKFHFCFNETSEEYFLAEHVNNKTECFYLIDANFTEIRWKNAKYTFDHMGAGYLSLFVVAGSGSWMDILYSASDATRIEDQPQYEANLKAYLYFVFFIIAVFFNFNFIVGAILHSLQKDKSEGRPLFVTMDQVKFMKALKSRLSRKPQNPAPQGSCRARLFGLVTSLQFEVFMAVVVCLYMVVQMAETEDQSMQVDIIMNWVHFTFFIIILIEFILKIIAFACHYFKSSWNILDFLVLLVYCIGLFLADLFEKYFVSPPVFSLLRLACVARVIHLIPRTRGIRKLAWALLMSLPAIFNISLLFSILTISYSVFGMFNFAYMQRTAGIDDMYNFETFWNSLICLVMTSPSSTWAGLLLPIMDTPPDCDPLMEHPGLMDTSNCGNPMVGIVFFVTFIILSSLLLVHLYIAVLLETFSLKNPGHPSDRDLDMFYNTWRKFDPDASQCIQYSDLSDFCSTLKDPLRIPKPNSIRLIHMDLPLLPGDKVHCKDILLALSTQVFGDSVDVETLKTRLEEKFATNSKVSCEPISSTLQRKQEDVAVTVIQRAFRKRLQQNADGAGQSAGGAEGGGAEGGADV
ncbi:sodium channel protein type 4 subunit alpha B-like [Notolabrus celidotus]|uniref:sodium channel protein type 4 subunit alpha B-like n=1 Tax=Notolabrus celidotus TaxID=1203425 RepID=UPI0014906FB6|nr:sodium channel protein type 4 subunit alpha B-like [Notolabrus celidotus]